MIRQFLAWCADLALWFKWQSGSWAAARQNGMIAAGGKRRIVVS
jgi:hypothetical protein